MNNTPHYSPLHRVIRTNRFFSRQNTAPVWSQHDVTNIAVMLVRECSGTLGAFHTILTHPRSLARPSASWRPPVKRLAGLPHKNIPALDAAITRYRVGPSVRLACNDGRPGNRKPAYLVHVRLTDPKGGRVDPVIAEAWIRAATGMKSAHCVHELVDEPTPTYCWTVTGSFDPVESPEELFKNITAA